MSSGVIFGSKILDVAAISMVVAQLYKFISTIFLQKKVVWSRLWETGGMPSSHSSSVVTLTTAVALTEGTRGVAFPICVVFAIIVMYDATGVRKEAGEHAGILNQLTEFFNASFEKKFKTEKLKELLGHSRTEVLAGIILGLIVPFIFKRYLQS
jgi:acid phosphatase family membrane protein YuiD